ncbi:hypothetical protein ACFWNT_19270 [Streptomyces sp. NPDC058409]|uniref:hypothetical protein n=1 Tax=Streptomyces sp. NPDC058409 TaxID=3346484 RepID=UPI003666E342
MAAGVSLSGEGDFWASTITWVVLAGLIVSKFLGIFGAAWLRGEPVPRLGGAPGGQKWGFSVGRSASVAVWSSSVRSSGSEER